MASYDTGWKTPGTVTNSNTSSVNNWGWYEGLEDAKTEDSEGVWTGYMDSGELSDTLITTNYGINIPTNNIITGIYVEVIASAQNTSHIDSVKLTDGTIIGSNKASDESLTGDYISYYFGGSADMWGTSLKISDINASSFGVAFVIESGHSHIMGDVDVIKVKVYYQDRVASSCLILGAF